MFLEKVCFKLQVIYLAITIVLIMKLYIFLEFQKVYDRLGIKLTEKGESFYQSRMESLVKDLEARGFLEEDNGRKIMWGDKSSIPFTIVKSDGGELLYTHERNALCQIHI